MISLDRDALLCDLAETYHIYDFEQLPLNKVAVFSVGLRDNSRIKTKMLGLENPLDRMIQMSIADRLAVLLWSKTKDGEKGKNKPALWSDIGGQKEKSEVVFDSGKDFINKREEILKRMERGNDNGD